MLTVFGAMAQLEREYLLDRQREGIEIARQNGKYKGRKPIEVNEGKFVEVYVRWKSGKCKGVEAMQELGLKPSTFTAGSGGMRLGKTKRHLSGGDKVGYCERNSGYPL